MDPGGQSYCIINHKQAANAIPFLRSLVAAQPNYSSFSAIAAEFKSSLKLLSANSYDLKK